MAGVGPAVPRLAALSDYLILSAVIDDIWDMRFDPRAGLTRMSQRGSGRRRHGRLEQEAVACGLGSVVDLSASGMRVIGRRVPQGQFTTWIRGLGVETTVNARAAWSKRIGLFRYEIGVQFANVTPETAKQLAALAMNNRLRRAV